MTKAVAQEIAEPNTWMRALPDLRLSLRGELILPGDAGYEEARKVWNGMIDKHPAMIVRCSGTADVIHAVNFARKHSLPVAVRGGGHNVAGTSTIEGGLLIDLSHMKGVHVDPEKRLAQVQGGLTWGELDKETQIFGLATSGGLVSSTGVAGFTLGGGIAWLMRTHGLACDNLTRVDLVTAKGELVHASRSENPDLFWGVRGGGGNFGIVTDFEFKLHPIGTMVHGGLVLHFAEKGKDVLNFFSEYTKTAPDELSCMLAFITAPPAPFLPAGVHGKPVVVIVVCYTGPADKAESVLKPLKDFGPPVADLIGPMPYLALQSMFDEGNPRGMLNYWKSHYIHALNPQAIDTIARNAANSPSPLIEVHLQHLGGAVARVPEDETAYANRKEPYVLNIVGKWTDAKDNERNIRWVKGFWNEMRPFATGGVYVNFLADSTEDVVKASYGSRQLERLATLKAKYDPENFFHTNHNITPKAK